jgi:L-ascorbate metabolism protein UlaG (beta-lactamase superfamily)
MATSLLRAQALRLERMRASPRFADGVFRNTARVAPGLKPGTALPVMSEFLFGGARRVPIAPLPSVSPLEPWARAPETGLRATWLGHSTLLIEIDGARVLTDPVWGERASPLRFAGPKRFQPVPVPIAALPPLDAVVISHDHYDHLDVPTVVELARRGTPIYTSLGVGAHLEAAGVPAERVVELDWWESEGVPGRDLRITAAPSQHFSGRGVGDRNRTLWSSLALTGPRHRVFFSGDTGLTPEYAEIAARLGPFDLVMLEVGAFHPAWGDIHLGPDNALEALALLGGGSFLPVHWGTFNLAIHAWDEPAERVLQVAPARGVPLVMPRLGEPVEPARAERVEPWWRAVSVLEKRSAGPAAAEVAPEALPPVGEPID